TEFDVSGSGGVRGARGSQEGSLPASGGWRVRKRPGQALPASRSLLHNEESHARCRKRAVGQVGVSKQKSRSNSRARTIECPLPPTGSPVSDAHHTPHPRHAATQPPRHAAGGFRRWARGALGPAPATLRLRHGAVPGRAPTTRRIRLAPAPPVASSCPGAELVPWYRARAVAPPSFPGAGDVPGPARLRLRL